MEKKIVVCDVCGKPAVDILTIRSHASNGKNRELDVCQKHADEILAKAHATRHGKKPELSSA